MRLTLSSHILINAGKSDLTLIQKRCTHDNPVYYQAKRGGFSVRNVPRTINLSERVDDGLIIPIGLLSKLLKRFPSAEVIDQRNLHPVEIPFTGELRDYQETFVADALKAGFGLMVLATGGGKTVSAVAVASRLKQRTLVLVKSRDLADQWRGAIKQFTGLECGLIGSGKYQEGEQFTVALIQTLAKRDLSVLNYGLAISDECHNAPANQYYTALNQLNARYKFGLSATPTRRDSLEFMIHAAIGPIVATVETKQLGDKVLPVTVYTVKHKFTGKPESWTEYLSMLAEDLPRNDLIIQIAEAQAQPTIILTGTVSHATVLYRMAEDKGLNPLLIHGQLRKGERKSKMKDAQTARLIVGTLSLLSEGIDLPHLTNLIFAVPVSATTNKANPSATRLLQSAGRCRRPSPGKQRAIVFDLIDSCAFGYSAFKKRNSIYKRNSFEVTHGKN